jgi:Uma2 family endonuclease
LAEEIATLQLAADGYNQDMSQSPRYIPHYTVADYKHWKGKWELWAGIPVAMSPAPSFRHQQTGVKLMRLLADQLESSDSCHCEVVYETDWRINDDTVVCPDVLIVCEPPPQGYLTGPPTFIAEILSPRTAGKDRVVKRGLYAEQGVDFYLIIDHEQKSVEALRRRDEAYEPISAADSLRFELHDGCEIELEVAALWNQ